jgi:hypothetical protein
MADLIRHKRSDVPSAVPAAGDLELGELAVNVADGRVFMKKADGSVVEVGGSGSTHVLSPRWEASRSNIADGYGAADGQLLPRATFPDAWAAINAGNVPVVDDAEWLADPLKRGCYSRGDGSTTFRLPDYNGKQAGSLGAVFLRGDGALSAGQAGLIQRDAFQGHNHEAYSRGSGAGYAAGTSGFGATIAEVANTKWRALGDQPIIREPISDGTNGTPRTASETRPLNVTGVWVIKLFGAVVNVGSADAAQLASDYANLAAALQTLDGQIDFTIIYPNGGSEASPANVAINSRYVEASPFPGHRVMCVPEIYYDGEWCGVGFSAYGTTNSVGVEAAQHNDSDVVIQTGINSIVTAAKLNFFTGASRASTTSAPCRVKVWKVKGAVA